MVSARLAIAPSTPGSNHARPGSLPGTSGLDAEDGLAVEGDHLEGDELVPLLLDYPLQEAGLYVVRPPPAGPMTSKVRALTDILLEKFGGEPTWDICYAKSKAAERAAEAVAAPA